MTTDDRPPTHWWPHGAAQGGNSGRVTLFDEIDDGAAVEEPGVVMFTRQRRFKWTGTGDYGGPGLS
ncbi:hypothetical protein Hanom_Chr03g00212811 [Helianthus anomalus]